MKKVSKERFIELWMKLMKDMNQLLNENFSGGDVMEAVVTWQRLCRRARNFTEHSYYYFREATPDEYRDGFEVHGQLFIDSVGGMFGVAPWNPRHVGNYEEKFEGLKMQLDDYFDSYEIAKVDNAIHCHKPGKTHRVPKISAFKHRHREHERRKR